MLSMAIFPLWWSAFSEAFGRRSIYLISFILFVLVTVPASGAPDPNGDLKIALDTLFNHPNLPAFFSKQMIQHLVTSNPSPAYVGRVAAVFKDNGQGVRGDHEGGDHGDPDGPGGARFRRRLQQSAIRKGAGSAAPLYGVGAGIHGAVAHRLLLSGSTEDPIWGLGQMWLRSPTVFNWFAPGYVPPGTSIEQAGLVAPEMQMTNVSSVVGYLNYMQNAIGSDANNGVDVFSSYDTEMGLAATPDALLDRINLLLMAGEMDSTLRSPDSEMR